DKYLQEAIMTFNNIGMRLDYARTLQIYSITLANSSQNADIRKKAFICLKQAKEIFQDCHATLDQENAEHLLASFRDGIFSEVTGAHKHNRQAR
ncbi:MAG TPA: hypothetical protein VHD63_18635, partial [Ktedonobacteraceae bacterium]|nr:hypothetical protein [Ktedonobacteraceae bacterium]